MIEKMFTKISSRIGQAVIKRKWIDQEKIEHYKLHEELDTKHAQDFFDVLAEPWKRSEEDRYLIEQGLFLGAYSFNQLFTSLYHARKRRKITDREIIRHVR